jgi:hypothetical protein
MDWIWNLQFRLRSEQQKFAREENCVFQINYFYYLYTLSYFNSFAIEWREHTYVIRLPPGVRLYTRSQNGKNLFSWWSSTQSHFCSAKLIHWMYSSPPKKELIYCYSTDKICLHIRCCATYVHLYIRIKLSFLQFWNTFTVLKYVHHNFTLFHSTTQKCLCCVWTSFYYLGTLN